MRQVLTENQSKLIKLADAELQKIGGRNAISRNANPAVRELGSTAGTREWALLKSQGAYTGILSDADCEKLIKIIQQ